MALQIIRVKERAHALNFPFAARLVGEVVRSADALRASIVSDIWPNQPAKPFDEFRALGLRNSVKRNAPLGRFDELLIAAAKPAIDELQAFCGRRLEVKEAVTCCEIKKPKP
jgi:hypothetical protein